MRVGIIYFQGGLCQGHRDKSNILCVFLGLPAGKSKVTCLPKRVLFYEHVCGMCSPQVNGYEEVSFAQEQCLCTWWCREGFGERGERGSGVVGPV